MANLHKIFQTTKYLPHFFTLSHRIVKGVVPTWSFWSRSFWSFSISEVVILLTIIIKIYIFIIIVADFDFPFSILTNDQNDQNDRTSVYYPRKSWMFFILTLPQVEYLPGASLPYRKLIDFHLNPATGWMPFSVLEKIFSVFEKKVAQVFVNRNAIVVTLHPWKQKSDHHPSRVTSPKGKLLRRTREVTQERYWSKAPSLPKGISPPGRREKLLTTIQINKKKLFKLFN